MVQTPPLGVTKSGLYSKVVLDRETQLKPVMHDLWHQGLIEREEQEKEKEHVQNLKRPPPSGRGLMSLNGKVVP